MEAYLRHWDTCMNSTMKIGYAAKLRRAADSVGGSI